MARPNQTPPQCSSQADHQTTPPSVDQRPAYPVIWTPTVGGQAVIGLGCALGVTRRKSGGLSAAPSIDGLGVGCHDCRERRCCHCTLVHRGTVVCHRFGRPHPQLWLALHGTISSWRWPSRPGSHRSGGVPSPSGKPAAHCRGYVDCWIRFRPPRYCTAVPGQAAIGATPDGCLTRGTHGSRTVPPTRQRSGSPSLRNRDAGLRDGARPLALLTHGTFVRAPTRSLAG